MNQDMQQAWMVHAEELEHPQSLPCFVATGWWRSSDSGTEIQSFRAFHLGVGSWIVEHPVGSPRVWVNDRSVLIDDLFEVAIYARERGLLRELVSIAISVSDWISDWPDRLIALAPPEHDEIAGRRCLRFELRSPNYDIGLRLWRDLDLPLVLKFQFIGAGESELSPHEFEFSSLVMLGAEEMQEKRAELSRIERFGVERRDAFPRCIEVGVAKVRELEQIIKNAFGPVAEVDIWQFYQDGRCRAEVKVSGLREFAAIVDRAPSIDMPYRTTYGPIVRLVGRFWALSIDYSGGVDDEFIESAARAILAFLDRPSSTL